VKAAFGLGFVIFVHELGHFLAAKLCGVKCEKFYVGFDVPMRIGPVRLPSVLFRKQWGETEYGIGVIPLGGYVKMLGQDDNPANSAKEAERIRIAREQTDASGETSEDTQIDPRSYPAKTVSQRLFIISAGVVMNLLFAVIFGMVAYRMGVSYTPCIVGTASPGLSAWNVNLRTGDRIVQMGREGEPSSHLRFDKDMMVKVMMTGADRDLDLLVRRHAAAGTSTPVQEWVTVRLSSPQEALHGRPIIGISPYPTTTVALSEELREAFSHLPAVRTEPALLQGDVILAVDGETVEDYVGLSRLLAQKVDQAIELTVRRDAPADSEVSPTAAQESQTLKVVVSPNPMRWLGLNMTVGPLVSVQAGSPADEAGFLVGDRITHLNGEAIGDPMRFPNRLRQHVGQSVAVTVQREDAPDPVVLHPELRQPTMLQTRLGVGNAIGAETLGVAFPIESRVASVESGTPAAKAGLQAGDVVQKVEFVPDSETDAELERMIFGRPEPLDLTANLQDWAHVRERIQMSLPKTRVKLHLVRSGEPETVELPVAQAEGWYVSDRGLELMTEEEVHRETDLSQAFHLGMRETVESIRQVYFILFRLVSGQMSPMNLGGPAAIATMAGIEASASTARLLIFLTLLSANLAVINFLPIPVLDGGHAMFLIYEGIFRRPLDERVAFGLTMIGFCFILGLMLFVIGLDVWRLTGLAG
jgi:regulator of sigma E protease